MNKAKSSVTKMRKTLELTKQANYWELPLQGKRVSRCFLDHAFGIQFLLDSESEIAIKIEGIFLFKRDNKEYQLSSNEDPEVLCPAFSVLHKVVKKAIICANGDLELEFMNGSSLKVTPEYEYEAWEVTSSNGLRVVCAPGGKLAIWEGTQSS